MLFYSFRCARREWRAASNGDTEMRKIIFSVTTVVLIAASVSIGSRIQAGSHPNTASVAGTLSPQEFMVRFGKDLPVEKWDNLF
jgi:hypothetical protein